MDNEQKQQQAKQLVSDTKRVRAFQDMVNSDGWKLYCELLNTKIEDATSKLFERPLPGAEHRGEDWDKGTVFAWIQARDLPGLTITVHKQVNSGPATEDEGK